ncbi:response regulator [Chryseobacterium sp. A301]
MNLNTTTLNFLLADDHHIVRQGIRFILSDLLDSYTVLEASNLKEIKNTLSHNVVDIAIMDAQYPDGNCLTILPEIREQYPNLKILIFSSFEESDHSLKFLEAGANGFLNKLSNESEIEEAIQNMLEKGEYIAPLTRTLMNLSQHNPNLLNPLNQLSSRELQIAELLAKGYGNLEISNELALKQNTISTFKKRIMEKLGLNSLVELVELVKTHQIL